MKPKLVLIKWLDSVGLTQEWEFIDEVDPLNPHICFSVGFLIDDNKDYKTLSANINSKQVIGRITIPVCSILAYRELM